MVGVEHLGEEVVVGGDDGAVGLELDHGHRAIYRLAAGLDLGQLLLAGAFDPPWVRDLAQDTGQKEELVRQLLRKLARQGVLFQVVKDLFYAQEHMNALATLITELATQNAQGQVIARDFRDATGLGRKRAIQIMECFNRLGLTRRVGDAHTLRPGAHWQG